MERRTTDTGDLPHERVLRQVAQPRPLGSVAGAFAEEPGDRVVGIVLEVCPLVFGVVEAWPGFEYQYVETACGEFFRDDRPATTGADHDHIGQRHPSARSTPP